MEEEQLEEVEVKLDCDAPCAQEASVPASVIKFGAPGMAFVSVSRGAGKPPHPNSLAPPLIANPNLQNVAP